ncbi:hypothetical protein KC19_9G180100 [Ceratodon purpureus]|uniref:Uncharacterized protein n=1 Tax=Ceratodon purpureus TaxID=3225 RepID=A0A8T0GT77_CERPU|nr:hypothetical protein KC19_9G180100 [Ceratodon purpureus]
MLLSPGSLRDITKYSFEWQSAKPTLTQSSVTFKW